MRDVVEMAREAGFFEDTGDGQGMWMANTSCLKAFADLVRADEREACAKVIESHGPFLSNGAMLAEAIRARGNT